MKSLKISEDAFWLRKKSYEISIKMQEIIIVHNQMQTELNAIRKKAE